MAFAGPSLSGTQIWRMRKEKLHELNMELALSFLLPDDKMLMSLLKMNQIVAHLLMVTGNGKMMEQLIQMNQFLADAMAGDTGKLVTMNVLLAEVLFEFSNREIEDQEDQETAPKGVIGIRRCKAIQAEDRDDKGEPAVVEKEGNKDQAQQTVVIGVGAAIEPEKPLGVEMEAGKALVIEKEAGKSPVIHKEAEKAPVIEKDPENAPVIEKEAEKVPVIEKDPEKAPVIEKEAEKVPVIEKEPEKVPVIENEPEKAPIIEKEPEQVPVIEKDPEKAPVIEKEAEKVPVIEKEAEKSPNKKVFVKVHPPIKKECMKDPQQLPGIEKNVAKTPAEYRPDIKKEDVKAPVVERERDKGPFERPPETRARPENSRGYFPGKRVRTFPPRNRFSTGPAPPRYVDPCPGYTNHASYKNVFLPPVNDFPEKDNTMRNETKSDTIPTRVMFGYGDLEDHTMM